MLAAGAVYRCFCTAEELDQRRAAAHARHETFAYDRRCDRLAPEEIARLVSAGTPYALRFRVPEGMTGWNDLVHGQITFPNKDIDDFVVLRSDGTPVYNMAVVSDDIAMRVTLVMRGDDHISNTPKQILLYHALGAPLPAFAHLPMIHGTDGKKLSKRHGATAVADYQNQGILPSAMLNFLALLGWSPGGDREIMTVPEMIELFSADGLLRKAADLRPPETGVDERPASVAHRPRRPAASRDPRAGRRWSGHDGGARRPAGVVPGADRPAPRAGAHRHSTSCARRSPISGT